MRENQRRALHEHEVGQQVCVNNHFSSADELKPVWVGPFPILRVHMNGAIAIQQGQAHERISICLVEPVLAQVFTFPAEQSGLGTPCIVRHIW